MSRVLGHVGPDHILLGLAHAGDGRTAQVLVSLGAGLSQVGWEVMRLRSGVDWPTCRTCGASHT